MVKGVACVDNVFDDEHIAALNSATQVFKNTYFSAALHAVAVGGGLEEIDLDGQIQFAHQIGDKHK